MSLLFCDGFDHYSSASHFTRKWSTVGTWQDIDATHGRGGGGCWRSNNSGGSAYATKNVKESSTLIVGFALWIGDNRIYGGDLIAFSKGTSYQFCARLTNDGRIEVGLSQYASYGIGGNPVVAKSPIAIQANQWNYIEMKLTPAGSGGRCIVRLNNVVVIDYTGDTNYDSSTTLDGVFVYFRQQWTGVTYIDDFYICNTEGTLNNDFLGDVKVKTLFPNANGTNSDFTGSDGNSTDNYLLVDDPQASVDDDTTYVKSSTLGQKDTYNFPASGCTASASIKGVQEVITAKREAEPGVVLSGLALSSGTELAVTDVMPPGAYTMNMKIFEKDPATNAAWGQAGLDAAEFGMKVGAP